MVYVDVKKEIFFDRISVCQKGILIEIDDQFIMLEFADLETIDHFTNNLKSVRKTVEKGA